MALAAALSLREGNLAAYHLVCEVRLLPREREAYVVVRTYLSRADAQANRPRFREKTYPARGQDYADYFRPAELAPAGVTPYTQAEAFLKARVAEFEAASDQQEP